MWAGVVQIYPISHFYWVFERKEVRKKGGGKKLKRMEIKGGGGVRRKEQGKKKERRNKERVKSKYGRIKGGKDRMEGKRETKKKVK